jgi:hypothetical protein
MTLDIFIGVFVCAFALVLMVLGALTAYFGSGKSRAVGIGYLVVGLAMGAVYGLYQHMTRPGFLMNSVIYPALFYGLAIIVGAVAALGVFIVGIIKT